jgi:hypothetical protein
MATTVASGIAQVIVPPPRDSARPRRRPEPDADSDKDGTSRDIAEFIIQK